MHVNSDVICIVVIVFAVQLNDLGVFPIFLRGLGFIVNYGDNLGWLLLLRHEGHVRESLHARWVRVLAWVVGPFSLTVRWNCMVVHVDAVSWYQIVIYGLMVRVSFGENGRFQKFMGFVWDSALNLVQVNFIRVFIFKLLLFLVCVVWYVRGALISDVCIVCADSAH